MLKMLLGAFLFRHELLRLAVILVLSMLKSFDGFICIFKFPAMT